MVTVSPSRNARSSPSWIALSTVVGWQPTSAAASPVERGGDRRAAVIEGEAPCIACDSIILLWITCVESRTLESVPQPLPRAFRRQLQAEDAAKLERILVDVGELAPEEDEVRPSARGGDWRRMRGVPVVGPGVGGTSIGTDPLRALLQKERQRQR